MLQLFKLLLISIHQYHSYHEASFRVLRTLIDVCHLSISLFLLILIFRLFLLFHHMKTTLSYFSWLIFLQCDLLAAQIFSEINGFVVIDSYITKIWFVTRQKANQKKCHKKHKLLMLQTRINKIMRKILVAHKEGKSLNE